MATPMTRRSPTFDREHPGAATIDRYEHLAIQDIKAAADTLRPVYDRLDAKDGYVSLEVSPYIADDTDATIAEARKLWDAVDRPNLMIKIPGTLAGRPGDRGDDRGGDQRQRDAAVRASTPISAVAEAYATGLEERVAQGQPIDRIASVASFFVSRIDTHDRQGRSTSASKDGRRRGRGAEGGARQGRDRQRQAGLCLVSGLHRVATAGRRSPPRARSRSGCCGRRPGSRTRPIPTRSTSTR